jgi:hypothetical protein
MNLNIFSTVLTWSSVEESSNSGAYSTNTNPIDTPVFLTENESKVIGKDKLFDANDLQAAPKTLPLAIYLQKVLRLRD